MPRLELSDRAKHQLRSLPPGVRGRLRDALTKIAVNPEGGKHLRGEFAGLRSWRIGVYRIIYQYSQGVIMVVTLGHRSTIYRQP